MKTLSDERTFDEFVIPNGAWFYSEKDVKEAVKELKQSNIQEIKNMFKDVRRGNLDTELAQFGQKVLETSHENLDKIFGDKLI